MRLAGAFALPLIFTLGLGSTAQGQTATSPRKAAAAAGKTLDIYISDTEGGKGTLFVSPSGETVLIDTGNPGDRDVGRIMDMISAAGVTKIDYLLSTHYHTDHVGGLTELVKRIPVAHFMDHGTNVEVPEAIAGFQAAYAEIYAKAKHTVLKPGDRIPVAGLDWRIVTSAGQAIETPLAGAGKPNRALCADFQRKPDPATPDDNAQSVGSVIRYGQFRALDLGDLLWNNEFDLVCPRNLIGTVDLYLVTHHGLDRSGSQALVHAVLPRVAVMQNGTRKGGAPTTFQTLRQSAGLEDIWTLHWSYAGGIEYNSAGVFIANIDDMPTIARVLNPGNAATTPSGSGPGNPAHAPFYPIKISAQSNGTFTVTNLRNGFSKTYVKR
ncbi:MAG: MBL fold metallo-hydrolase [Gemmatimonadota bacterium]|nr:MBL fold metallo-hydrolase [Gemmatimonadota bacterium]